MKKGKKSVQTRLKTTSTMEANPANPTSPASIQKNDINKLFAEITKIGTTLKTVASDVSIIKSDTTELKNAVNALQIRLEEAEDRIGSLEDSTANMANESKGLARRVEQLWNHVEDQENRGRRNNIKLIGLKEGKEAGSTINDYVKKILNDGLGLQGAEYEIERSHRSGGPRPDDNQPPRMILVTFLRYTAQQKVLTAAKKNRGVRWEDCSLSIYEDLTKERSDLRRCFSQTMKTLWQHQVKHTLPNPANLRFTWKGKRWSFTDPKKAEEFVGKNIHTTEHE
ncbi:LINE-1 type transposase domain containing protein 1 [Dissostichus eleginoides]|uniref:LINE-1 type transposase domain containing protein 1 n=1 Tax=Dissostichus eleginoides TaxID=100907 RepID=A0AAD9BEV7_DISEL|nr:LINE-1 type transposase domain containing protein 1 [Dissostichus eleginoides]